MADIEGFSYLDEGLQPGTTYSYSVVVTAIYWFISYVTYSWGSNRAIATTLTDSVPPQIPVHVRAIGLSPSEIQVTWDAASDNDQVSVYAIYRDGAFVGTSPVTTFVDAGLSVTTTYSYAVAARDRSGNQSALSAPALGMTLARTILVDPGAANNAMALDSAATPHFIHIPASSRTPLR